MAKLTCVSLWGCVRMSFKCQDVYTLFYLFFSQLGRDSKFGIVFPFVFQIYFVYLVILQLSNTILESFNHQIHLKAYFWYYSDFVDQVALKSNKTIHNHVIKISGCYTLPSSQREILFLCSMRSKQYYYDYQTIHYLKKLLSSNWIRQTT